MDLRDYLREIYPNQKDEKYAAMLEDLSNVCIYSIWDFDGLNEETLTNANSFSKFQVEKLLKKAKNPDSLIFALKNEIYYGMPETRLDEIKRTLNSKEIYSRMDILNFNTNKLRREGLLSKAEIDKLEEFIKKNNMDYYDKIMKEKDFIESDLKPILMEIFRGCSEERVSEIEDILKKQDVTSKKDLLFVDTNRLRISQEISETEVTKIERYLIINNKEHYDEMKSKEIDIIPIIKELFEASSYQRISEIQKFFVKQAVTSKTDLLHVNTNKLMENNVLSEWEISKIENYLQENNREQYDNIMKERELEKYNPKNLDDVLNKIFLGTPDNRVNEIKEILQESDIYSGTDVSLLDTIKLRNERSLTDTEILKIEQYIRENDSERFECIRDKLMFEQKKKFLDILETAKKKESFNKMEMEQRKVHLSMKQERHKSLIKEMEKLVNKISQMCDNKPDLKKSVETRFSAFGIFPFIYASGMSKFEAPIQEPDFEKLPKVIEESMSRIKEIYREVKEIEEDVKKMSDETSDSKNNLEHYEKIMSERELEKLKNLKYVLKQIYSDTSESRLNEIEQILNTEQIYSGWGVLVADTNNFREKQIFSEIEILKLEEHILKYNRERNEFK